MLQAILYALAKLRRYAPPPHQHVCDFERSNISVRPDGSMLCECAVSGCNVSMVVGHSLAQYFQVERETQTL